MDWKPSTVAAFVSTAIISLVPNVVFLCLPNADSKQSMGWLSLGQSLAAGGLLGDVFLHTLAETTDADAGYYLITGFVDFLAVDLLIRSLHQPDQNHHGTDAINRSAVLLNLGADILHNFTDGLAIGASYALVKNTAASDSVLALLTNHTRGGLATLSILFHEIPHELGMLPCTHTIRLTSSLGDFCTLVRAGYTRAQAIQTQLFTSVAAFCGTATAVMVSSEEWAEERLLWVTAGGFLYLAGTTILPEVLDDRGSGSGLFRLTQLFAFCLGIFFLYMVAYLEHTDGGHSHSHGGHQHHERHLEHEHHYHQDHHHHFEHNHNHGGEL